MAKRQRTKGQITIYKTST